MTERLTLPRGTSESFAVKAVPAGAVTYREYFAVALACLVASLIAQAWSWRHHAMLNYGDAVAHLHIARRILDSHRPGLTQLGSVWLPLPHLLMLPFTLIYPWWADGIAGAIPSGLAYIAACLGIYRLARRWLAPAPCAIALVFFALNPNLLYLQTTAMTEPLFLCEMVWVVVLAVEWRAGLDENPARSGRLFSFTIALLIAAVFTRYDGWALAFLVWIAMAATLAGRGRLNRRAFWIASLLLAAAPAAWFAYNAGFFGDWLYFARGPFSAKAIELHTAAPGYPPHPGWHNPWVSLLFFVKVSELDAAAAFGNLLLAASVLGTAWACLTARRRAFLWALLLWLPVPFYCYSVAYGSVPIFIPPWWPHSWYNTRYGMELLPALALGLAFVAQIVLAMARKLVREFKPAAASGLRWSSAAVALLAAIVVFNSAWILHQHPLVYVEGMKNAAARRPYDRAIPPLLRSILASHPGGVILMNTSLYPELVSLTGIPLRQTLNESDKQYFKAALAAPAAHAAIVIAFDGGEIDRAVKAHPQGLKPVRRVSAKGQPSATIYVSGAPPSA